MKIKISRSPAHPGMSLEEAIEKAKLFYKNNKRYAVSRSDEDPAAYTSIGYGTANGAAKRALSTLLQFGLLEKMPGGEDSKVKISELGFKIAAYDDDPERDRHIAEAARNPKVFKELLDEFQDGLPASDPPIRTYLLNHDFKLEAIPPLIRDFRATVTYAKLYEDGKINVEEEYEDDPNTMDLPREIERAAETEAKRKEAERKEGGVTATASPSVPQGMKAIPVMVGPGKEIILQYPATLTEMELDTFEAIWKVYRPMLVTQPPTAPVTETHDE